ncbi:MAG: DEAD/DEAH box helicase [Acidimicrobiaceae bacterium]|nr:DEAD/DEAH box helicase [Acidimicrobiaceae bacterium]
MPFDVFSLRDRLISEYRSYSEGFVEIADERIRSTVNDAYDRGLLWPAPRVGLNPSFEPGASVAELVGSGRLHPLAAEIFRKDKTEEDPHGKPMTLHRHQVKAIYAAAQGRSYVLTTGTGSGKSLAYMVPIVNHVLRSGSGRGIKALVLYPMNALANSQCEELSKFLDHGPWTASSEDLNLQEGPESTRPVTFAVFTGQQDEQERQKIRDNPPDVLLTNYVMAELILTRYNDVKLVNAMKSLRFLVLDELHTYRGRQGADVAMLVRRIREACGASELQCVGTSATLSTEGSHSERGKQVATVASKLFGTEVRPSEVITETLQRITDDPPIHPNFKESLKRSVTGETQEPSDYNAMCRDPLSSFIESVFGSETQDGVMVRVKPIPVEGDMGGAEILATETDSPREDCEQAIRRRLLAGTKIRNPKTGNPVFAFRLHQFLSAGGTVHATPEAPCDRSITMRVQRFVRNERHRAYLPLAFCRACGQEYYVVSRETSSTGSQRGKKLVPRDLGERTATAAQPGFLFIAPEPSTQWDQPWPLDSEGIRKRLPADWFNADGQLRDARRNDVPAPLQVAADGSLHPAEALDGTQTTTAFWLTAPFRLCMRCAISHANPRGGDFSRLAPLDSQGRSTATTITSLATIRQLREVSELPRTARKLLSFTDNRQDASLQAGHLNDFVNVTLLRAALWRALSDAGAEGLSHDLLASRVVQALGLHVSDYSLQPAAKGRIRSLALKALTEMVEYRLYLDLSRGWRVTLPNLEQCGMLHIDYPGLDELAEDTGEWRHRLIVDADPETRLRVMRALLETGRRDLGICVGVLDPGKWDPMEHRSEQHLVDQWSLAGELQTTSSLIATGMRSPDSRRHKIISITPRSGFGQFLNRADTFGHTEKLSLDERLAIIDDLVETLTRYGLLRHVETDGEIQTWQIPAAALVWKMGDGTPYHDPIRTPSASETGLTPNPYFVGLYTSIAAGLGTQSDHSNPVEDSGGNIEAREHTAQVAHEQRVEREHRFRDGNLPVLVCSPTMELGVDIAELNVVNMRNVPPTPANYAQRSGRAGRSGQAALVTTFCSSGSSHDQFFFRRQELMVSGEVEAPRLDLTNEELVRSHIHSVWLACSGLDLGSRMGDLLDLSSEGEEPSLKLLDQAADVLADRGIRKQAQRRAQGLLDDLSSELAAADWFTPSWLDDTMRAVPQRFEEALLRWRSLYAAAHRQAAEQGRIMLAHGHSKTERKLAEKLRREAEHQIELLRGDSGAGFNSDFYPYRYLASEGFLPGYSFPRLPLSAYVSRRDTLRGELIQRPRFLAVSEFGPHSIIYHEGSQYSSNRVQLAAADLDAAGDSASILKTSVKRCEHCGYMHQIDASSNPDLCELCSRRLPPATRNMFRMGNVATRRRERITSDEEQRQRMGYEILSAVCFSHRSGTASHVERCLAATTPDGSGVGVETPRLRLRYGDTATIWRINQGFRRSGDLAGQIGFVLDTATGYWVRDDSDELSDNAEAAPTSRRIERVIPYVTDTLNALLIEPVTGPQPEALLELHNSNAAENVPNTEMMASLQASLLKALQAVFRLESNEIAAEALPSRDDRRMLLIYEAEEGGAGVLKQLVDDPSLWSRVAAEALRICHIDPLTGSEDDADTGEDGACEGACYDCLMSYANQPDHSLLDRKLAVDFLAPFVEGAEFLADDHDTTLAEGAESGLEREFLKFLGEHSYRRPDRGQVFFEEARTRPDFVYDDACAVVYVDGLHHDYPERARRDAEQSAAMQNLGYRVIRFSHHDDWRRIVDDNPAVFGPGSRKDVNP